MPKLDIWIHQRKIKGMSKGMPKGYAQSIF